MVRAETDKAGLSIAYTRKSIYDITPNVDGTDRVICCEVLENLTNPALALQKLVSIAKQDLIVSVPREPVWHILAMARGKSITALGNTLGHYKHWSSASFVKFVSRYADVVEVKSRCRGRWCDAALSVSARDHLSLLSLCELDVPPPLHQP